MPVLAGIARTYPVEDGLLDYFLGRPRSLSPAGLRVAPHRPDPQRGRRPAGVERRWGWRCRRRSAALMTTTSAMCCGGFVGGGTVTTGASGRLGLGLRPVVAAGWW